MCRASTVPGVIEVGTASRGGSGQSPRLAGVTRTTRILAIIGVAYLLAVAGLYFALFDRNEDFARNGETLTGTVQRVAPLRSGGS